MYSTDVESYRATHKGEWLLVFTHLLAQLFKDKIYHHNTLEALINFHKQTIFNQQGVYVLTLTHSMNAVSLHFNPVTQPGMQWVYI